MIKEAFTKLKIVISVFGNDSLSKRTFVCAFRTYALELLKRNVLLPSSQSHPVFFCLSEMHFQVALFLNKQLAKNIKPCLQVQIFSINFSYLFFFLFVPPFFSPAVFFCKAVVTYFCMHKSQTDRPRKTDRHMKSRLWDTRGCIFMLLYIQIVRPCSSSSSVDHGQPSSRNSDPQLASHRIAR